MSPGIIPHLHASCHSAWSPNADRRGKLLNYLEEEGSHSEADSQLPGFSSATTLSAAARSAARSVVADAAFDRTGLPRLPALLLQRAVPTTPMDRTVLRPIARPDCSSANRAIDHFLGGTYLHRQHAPSGHTEICGLAGRADRDAASNHSHPTSSMRVCFRRGAAADRRSPSRTAARKPGRTPARAIRRGR